MKSANEQIQDLIVITSHNNERYKNYLTATYTTEFNKILKKLQNIIKINYDPEDTTIKAKTALQRLLNDTLKAEMGKMQASLSSEISEFIDDSVSLYADQLKAVFSSVEDFVTIETPKKETVQKGYNKDYLNFKNGSHTVESLWATFIASLNNAVIIATNQAYVTEEEESDYIDTLFGTVGTTNVSKNHLATLIATLVAHGYNSATKYTDLVNQQVFSGYVYSAILDNRTSDICLFLDGKEYFYGHPEKSTLPYEAYPPQHHNCRSSTYPITKSYVEMGINPEDLTTQQKELLSGELPQAESYSQFFNKQPKSVQKEILGPARYDLFSRGEITVDKFFTRDGRRLTLDELMKKGYTLSGDYLRYVRKS